jgi:hypothetical protein
MYQRRLISIAILAIIQSACGGSGGGGASFTGASVSGAVPGTMIEAFGDNGSYYATSSNDNGSAQHPFRLNVQPGVGFHLAMVTNEGTPEEVVTPIGFRDSSGMVRTRLVLDKGENIDLGYIPLHMSRNDAASDDNDSDGVLDHPLVLDDVGANNPLSQSDVDNDNVNDWDDPDHGGYHYDRSMVDPQDHDDDGVQNVYDNDFNPRSDDRDGDGLPDHIDANPDNDPNHNNGALYDDCDHDGYNDEDHDHDGFHDDDNDRDGYHDDDVDHDGDHDSDHDNDGEDDDEGHSCGGGSGTTPPASGQPPAGNPGPGTGLDGQSLYIDNCTNANCHSASGMRGRTASQISAAISSNRGGMGSITLTANEIQAIADYLAR